ncbi:MerR family transcriptional regulator [Lysinibacillus endophyticus]|uniref:MerR family transcriptional regulator n=1 Tax=Ureibacillus endophyticus TaxID=1978490 RepID=UPI00313719EC
MKEHLSIGEFAKRTGVSIRTLHYYDELGLLTPLRTESGRRFYNNTHFVTMQKIVTLKFLGFSLEQMKNLIQQNDWSVKQSLEFQKKLMEEKLSQIQKVINALDHAINLVDEQDAIDASIFASIIQGIQLQDEHKEWLKSIYTDEKVDEIFDISIEKQQALERKFANILAELKNKCGTNPADADVQQLIHELMTMLQEIVGEDLHSFFEKVDGAEIEEEDPMQPLPLSDSELEWAREAMKIYLKEAGIEEEAQ